jgi:ankyrin repeat protein
MHNNTDVLNFFLTHGHDVNCVGKIGSTLLHDAAESSKLEMIRFLLEFGPNVNACNSRGETPLDLAPWHSKISEEMREEMKKILASIGQHDNREEIIVLLEQHGAVRSQKIHSNPMAGAATSEMQTQEKSTPLNPDPDRLGRLLDAFDDELLMQATVGNLSDYFFPGSTPPSP